MVEAAKQKGLNHVRDFVKRNDPRLEKYDLVYVSPDIVVKILKGGYYSIEDIKKEATQYNNKDIIIFCRIVKIASSEAYIVESFYWDGV